MLALTEFRNVAIMTNDKSRLMVPARWDPMTGEQRPADEMSNLLTHVLGFLLSLAATFLLMPIVMARQELRTTLACGVYCLTLVLLYGASTLSHAFRDRGLRRMFRTLDQACIYLLIAGSMTPFALVFLRQGRWSAIPDERKRHLPRGENRS